MRHALSLLVLSLLATAASAAPIGRILVAVGDVSAQRNGKTVPLKARAEIELGDLIKTGPASNAQVRLTDGAIIAIKPITEFKFDDYQFSGKQDGTEKGAFSLVKGGFRTITGAIGKQNPQNYKVSTPMANIGIRGTFYNLAICDSACFNPDGSKAEDGLYGGVTDGKIAVTNQAGEKTFGNEEFFHVASANETPQSLIAPPAFLQDKLEGQKQSKKDKEDKGEAAKQEAKAEKKEGAQPAEKQAESKPETKTAEDSGSGFKGDSRTDVVSNDGTIQTDPMIGKVEDNYKSNEQPDATKNIGGAGLVGLLAHSYGDGGNYSSADSHLAEFHGKSDLFLDANNKIGGAVLEDGTTVEIKADLAQEGRIDSNGSSVLFWGTWTNGSITVTEPERPSETDTLSPTQAVHFIGGAPFSDLPTSGGVVTYTHAAHTPASFSDGNGSGDMLSTSQVQIKFGTGQVHATLDIELTRANNTNVYQLAVPFKDGHINVATGGITGKGSATFISGGADSAILECGSGCNGDIAGFVAGPNGKFVGLGWGIDGNTATPRQVTGVAAFVEQGSTGTLYTGTGAITGGGTSPVP